MQQELLNKQIEGLLIGTAVGDAIGLAREGLSRDRAIKLFGIELQHSLIVTPWGHLGLCSDDTEHALLVSQCLLAMDAQGDNFLRLLAFHLRRWFLTLPAGIGMATLKACIKLCLGFSPCRSGVMSAGNGAVMRAPIIGWFCSSDLSLLMHLIKQSTEITHTDTRVFEGAWVIAMAVRHVVSYQPSSAPIDAFLNEILPTLKGEELIHYLQLAQLKLSEGATLTDYLSLLHIGSKGVTGYVNHSVPAVIYAWLRYYGDYKKTISALVMAGGDTDTHAAIAGALSGVSVGVDGIPSDWINGINDWPMTTRYIKTLSGALANKKKNPNKIVKVKSLNWVFLWIRNFIFFWVIVVHGFRRLFPPY